MLFRDINFDTIVYTVTKLFIQILDRSEFLLFIVLSVFCVCDNCQSLYQNLELNTLNHVAYYFK